MYEKIKLIEQKMSKSKIESKTFPYMLQCSTTTKLSQENILTDTIHSMTN